MWWTKDKDRICSNLNAFHYIYFYFITIFPEAALTRIELILSQRGKTLKEHFLYILLVNSPHDILKSKSRDKAEGREQQEGGVRRETYTVCRWTCSHHLPKPQENKYAKREEEKKSLDVEKVISHLVTQLHRTIPRTQLNILLSCFNDDLVKLKSGTKKKKKDEKMLGWSEAGRVHRCGFLEKFL